MSLGFASFGLSIADWKSLADALYDFESLANIPMPRNETEPAYRLWNSVRHVRKLAAPDTMHPHEYATAVAVQLLRRTTLPKGNDQEEEERRIYGYVLAERLALKLSE